MSKVDTLRIPCGQYVCGKCGQAFISIMDLRDHEKNCKAVQSTVNPDAAVSLSRLKRSGRRE